MAEGVLFDQLETASFRGVEFEVESSDHTGGRRVQVHEYPQRDKPYVEDIGRGTREFRITGFVVGDDYVDQAGAVMAEIEKGGEGTLIHPWLGSLKVSVYQLARVAFNKSLGYAVVDMSFVEAGELDYPSAETSTPAESRLAADDMAQMAQQAFAGGFSVDGVLDFVKAQAIGNLGDVFDLMQSSLASPLAILGFASQAQGALDNVLGLLDDPLGLAEGMFGFFDVSDLIDPSTMDLFGLISSIVSLVGSVSLSSPTMPSGYVTPSRVQAIANETAINALTRQALLTQAVGISSQAAVVQYDSAVHARAQLVAAIDAESLTAPDTVYQSLQRARAAVYRDITERARDSARLSTYTPRATMPAVMVAYELYEDAERDEEIVTRNRVRHPGFVPPVDLQVLTR